MILGQRIELSEKKLELNPNLFIRTHPQIATKKRRNEGIPCTTVGEQLKTKMDISPCPLYIPWMENKHCDLNCYITKFITDASGRTYTDLDMIVPLHAQTS